MRQRTFDVFLSYNREDRRSVELLAQRLKRKGIVPWLDKWNLIPGTPFQPEIEEALASCLSCAVFIGKSGIGPWQSEEMRAAIQRRVSSTKPFRVIPVLLPGAKRLSEEELPPFLIASTWVDFCGKIGDQNALHQLVCGIKGIQPGKGRSRGDVRTEWVIVLSGTVDEADKARAEAIVDHLRHVSGDATLTMKKVTRGNDNNS